jgi:hypothetical protein
VHSAAPPDAPGTWHAAAEPVDMTDHSIELPALAPMPRHRAARVGRMALVLVLILGCAGGAVAFSGVLETRPDAAPPPATVGDASVVAPARAHHAKAKPKLSPKRKHHHRVRHRHRHATGVPRHAVAATPAPATHAAPVPTTAAAPAPVRHVSSSPAPTSAPSKPSTSTTTAAPQPSASAPSGEPGRQPPPPQP